MGPAIPSTSRFSGWPKVNQRSVSVETGNRLTAYRTGTVHVVFDFLP